MLRRHERDGRLSAEEARTAWRSAGSLIDERYPHAGPLGELAWRWRHNVTFYDGLYLALAVVLDAPLLTADPRLSRVPGVPCTVEVV